MTMAQLQDTEQKVNIQSQLNDPHPHQEGAMTDITDSADFEGFEQSIEEQKVAFKRCDAYQKVIYRYLQEDHSSCCMHNVSQEKKEIKAKVRQNSGKSLEQPKAKLGVLNNSHRLSKKEKLQLWELKDQCASDASHTFVDDHIQWLKNTLNVFKYCFPGHRKPKSHSYMEFVEIVQAEVSANAAMFFNMSNESLSTTYLHVTLPGWFKNNVTKSRLEKLLKKSPLFFYDHSHEVWEPMFVLLQKSDTSEMHHYVQWQGILDIRKMWAIKGSYTCGAEVRSECVKSVLAENSQMTVNEIAEILCSYIEIPNCSEVTSLIHHMLQTSKNFRRCEDQGMEQDSESRYFKRSLTKSATTPVMAVICSSDEKSKSFVTWASIVSKYAQDKSYEPAKHSYYSFLKAKRDHDQKNNKDFPLLKTSESARTTSQCTPTLAPAAVLSMVNQKENTSNCKTSEGKSLVTNTDEEKACKIFVSTVPLKNSGSDPLKTNSVSCKSVPNTEPVKDLVMIHLSPKGATTVGTVSSKQPPVSCHYLYNTTEKTNIMQNKTQIVSRVSLDAKDIWKAITSKVRIMQNKTQIVSRVSSDAKDTWKASTSKVGIVDTQRDISTVYNVYPVLSYQAETLESSRKSFRNISSQTLMSVRDPQMCKTGTVPVVESQRGSLLFRKNNVFIVPLSHSHPSQSQVSPCKPKAILPGNSDTEKNLNSSTFLIPLIDSNVKQVEENTDISLSVNKDSRNTFERTNVLVPVTGADSGSRQENTSMSATIKKADSRNIQENSGISTFSVVADSRYMTENTGKSAPVTVAYPRNIQKSTGISAHASVRYLNNRLKNTGMSATVVGASSKIMLKNSDSRKIQENTGISVLVTQGDTKNIPESTGISTHVTLSDSRNLLEGTSFSVPETSEGSTNIQEASDLSSPVIVAQSRNMQKNSDISVHAVVMDSRNAHENLNLSVLANQKDSENIQENTITSVPSTKVDSQNIQETVDVHVPITKVDSKYMQENSGIAAPATQRDPRNSQKNSSMLVPGTEGNSRNMQENIGISLPSTQDQRHIQENVGISSPVIEKNSRNTKENPSMTEGKLRNIQENAGISAFIAQGDPGNIEADTSKSFVTHGNAKITPENNGLPIRVIESDSRNMKENPNIPSPITLTDTENVKENMTVSVEHAYAYSRNIPKRTDAHAHLTQEDSRCTLNNCSSSYNVDHTYSRHVQDDTDRLTSMNLSDSSKTLENSCSAPVEQMASGKPNGECVSSRRRKLGCAYRMRCCNDTEHEPKKKRLKMHKKRFDMEALEKYRVPLIMGWIREVVTRSFSPKLERERDVYYHSPLGKKLRSSVEIQKYLEAMETNDLTMDNFTYKKNLLGFGEPYEISRYAKIRYAGDLVVTRPRRRGLYRNNRYTSNIPTTSYEEIPPRVFPDDGYWVTSFFDTGNDMGADDVDIVNEAGDVTGYEEWINNNSLNKNCIKSKKKTVKYTDNYDVRHVSLQHRRYSKNADMMKVPVAERDGGRKPLTDCEDEDIDVEMISNCGDDAQSVSKLTSNFVGNGFRINQSETSEDQRKDQGYMELVSESNPLVYLDSERIRTEQIAGNYKEAKISPFVNNAKIMKSYVGSHPQFQKESGHCSLKLEPNISPSRLGLDVSHTESWNQRPNEKETTTTIPVQLNHFQENLTVHASNVSEEAEINTQVYGADNIKSEFINDTQTVGDQQSSQEQNHFDKICKMTECSCNSAVSAQLQYCLAQNKYFSEKDIPENSLPVSNISKRNMVLCHNSGNLPVVTQIGDGSHIKEELMPVIGETSIQNSLICNQLAVNNKNVENVNEFTTIGVPEIKVEIPSLESSELGIESSVLIPNLTKGTIFQNQSHVDHRVNNDISEVDFISSETLKPKFIAASNSDRQWISETNIPLSYGTIVYSDKHGVCLAENLERKPSNENLITSEHIGVGLGNYPPEKAEHLHTYIPTQNGVTVPSEECIAASSQQNVPSDTPVNYIQNPQIALQYLQSYTPVSRQHNLQSKEHILTVSSEKTNARPLQNMPPFNSLMHSLNKPTSEGCMDSVSLPNKIPSSRCLDSIPVQNIYSNDCLDPLHIQNMTTSNGYMDTKPLQSIVASNGCMEATPQTVAVYNGYKLSATQQSITRCIDNVSLQNLPISSGYLHTLPKNNTTVSTVGADTIAKKSIAVSTGYSNTIPQRNIAVSSHSMVNIPLSCTAVSSACIDSTPWQNTAVSNSHLYTSTVQKMCMTNGKLDVIPMQNTMVSCGDFRPLQSIATPIGSINITPQNIPVSDSRNTLPWQSIATTNSNIDTTGHGTHMACNYEYKDGISLQNLPVSCGVKHTLPQKNMTFPVGCTNTIPIKNTIPQENKVTTTNFMNSGPLLRIAVPSGYMENTPQNYITVSNSHLHTNPAPKMCMSNASVSTIPVQNTVLSGSDLNAHPLKVAKVSYIPLAVEQDNILPFKNQSVPSEPGQILCAQNTKLRQQIPNGVHQMPLPNQQFKLYYVSR